MSKYVRLTNNLEILNLEKIKENIGKYIGLINKKEKSIVDALYELTNLEVEVLNEKTINSCIRSAGFPNIKTFDDFDFSFQPTINKEQVLDFKNLRFLEEHENIILVGSPRSWKNSFSNSYWYRSC